MKHHARNIQTAPVAILTPASAEADALRDVMAPVLTAISMSPDAIDTCSAPDLLEHLSRQCRRGSVMVLLPTLADFLSWAPAGEGVKSGLQELVSEWENGVEAVADAHKAQSGGVVIVTSQGLFHSPAAWARRVADRLSLPRRDADGPSGAAMASDAGFTALAELALAQSPTARTTWRKAWRNAADGPAEAGPGRGKGEPLSLEAAFSALQQDQKRHEALRHELAEMQARAETLIAERDLFSDQVVLLQGALQTQDARIAELVSGLQDLDDQNQGLHDFLDELRSSNSWRLTRPVRAVSGLLRAIAGRPKPQSLALRRAYRPWGWEENLVFDHNVAVRRVVVTAGETFEVTDGKVDGQYLLVVSGVASLPGPGGDRYFHEAEMIDTRRLGARGIENAEDGPLVLLAVKAA